MSTVRPRIPTPAGPAGARRAQRVTAIGPPTASRTLRVEPLVRRRRTLRVPS
jgi:hypothetical protein